MARIPEVSAGEAGLRTRLAFVFARRSLARLSGRDPQAAIEPLELMAHAPGLLAAYGRLEQATAKLHSVDKHLRDLAELKAATLTGCESLPNCASTLTTPSL